MVGLNFGAYGNVSRCHVHIHIVAGFHISADLNVTAGHRCVYIPACGDVLLYVNAAIVDSHLHIFFSVYSTAYRYDAFSNRCLHVHTGINAVINIDCSFAGRQRYISVLGFYGFLNVYIAFSNSHVHIVLCNYAAVSVASYCNVARTHGHIYIVAGVHIRAHGNVARLHVHIYIVVGLYIGAYLNIALNGGLQLHIATGGYVFAYLNVARLRLHGHVFLHGDVGFHTDIALAPGLHIQALARGHVVRHHQIAVGHDQVCVLAGCQLSVLGKDNAFGAFHILIVGSMYGNVAAFRSGLAINVNLALAGFQIYILFGHNRFHVFPVIANRNIAVCNIYVYAAVLGFHSLDYGYVARLHVHIYIVVGLYICAYGHVAINGGLQLYIVACGYVFAYFNIARLRLHGHVFLHGDVGFHTDIALAPGLHIQALARGHVVRHHQIAVGHDQVCVLAGCQLSVLGKDNAFGAFHILIVGSMYGNVAAFRSGLAINVNLALAGFQIHILFGHNRFHVFPIIANRNVAFCHLYIHIAVLSLHGLIYGYASSGGYIQRHIVTCHYVALAVAAAYLNLAGSCGHGYILACGDVFPDRNIAVIGRCGYIARHVNIPLKGYIAFLINRYGQVLFGQGIARYVDTAVSGMQGQVAARIQHAVLRDHDILIVLFIQRFYSNIAFLGLGRAVHGNDTVLNIQVDVLLRQDRI